MELRSDDLLNIDITEGDSLNIDLGSMAEVQEMNVNLQSDDELTVDMESDDSLEVQLIDGIPVGVDDYEVLRNKPKVNGVELLGNKSNEDLNMRSITNMELARILV